MIFFSRQRRRRTNASRPTATCSFGTPSRSLGSLRITRTCTSSLASTTSHSQTAADARPSSGRRTDAQIPSDAGADGRSLSGDTAPGSPRPGQRSFPAVREVHSRRGLDSPEACFRARTAVASQIRLRRMRAPARSWLDRLELELVAPVVASSPSPTPAGQRRGMAPQPRVLKVASRSRKVGASSSRVTPRGGLGRRTRRR
jgi:hypothetical protein